MRVASSARLTFIVSALRTLSFAVSAVPGDCISTPPIRLSPRACFLQCK